MFTTNAAQGLARRRKLAVLAGAVAVLVLAVARVDTAAAGPWTTTVHWGDGSNTNASAGCASRMITYWDARRSNWTLNVADWANIYQPPYRSLYDYPQSYVKLAIFRAGSGYVALDTVWGAIPQGPMGISWEGPWPHGEGAFTILAAFKHNGVVMDNAGWWYVIGTLTVRKDNGVLTCFN